MNFISCLHPRSVMRYGELVTVPCGHCEYCKHIRNIGIAERLRLECQNHKYVVFGTLTYADVFLPRLHYDNFNLGFVVPDEEIYDVPVNQDAGLFIPWKFLSKKDKHFVDECERVRGFVPRLRKYDAQNFIKRLRINIKRSCFKNEKYDKSQFISYAITGEYGPTGYRPHFHFLLFFDHDQIARKLRTILHKTWKYGSINFRFSTDATSARYVAQYLACSYSLPSFYKSKEICPFILFSKSCPIGMCAVSKEEIQRCFRCQSPTVTVKDREKQADIQIPLWRSFEDKLYPKIVGFDRLDNWQRIELYRFVNKSRSPEDLKRKVFELLDSHNTPFIDNNKKNSFVYEYFFCVFSDRSDILLKDVLGILVSYRGYNQLSVMFYKVRTFYFNLNYYGLKDEDEYFSMIDKYDSNKELYYLKKQFEFEQSFYMLHSEWLPFLVGDKLLEDKLALPPVKHSLEVLKCSVEHSKKNRAKNEYLNKRPELKGFHKYSEIPEFFNFL